MTSKIGPRPATMPLPKATAAVPARSEAPGAARYRSGFSAAGIAPVKLTGETRPTTDPLAIAQAELDGYEGTGKKYWDYTHTGKTDWCASFVSYVYAQAGRPLGTDEYRPNGCEGIVHCDQMKAWLQATDQWIPAGEGDPQPGDIVVFDFNGDGYMDHVGILKEYDPATGEMVCIEGNAGGGAKGAGDGELLEVRRTIDQVAGFGHVPAPAPGNGRTTPVAD